MPQCLNFMATNLPYKIKLLSAIFDYLRDNKKKHLLHSNEAICFASYPTNGIFHLYQRKVIKDLFRKA